ncbi:MAG: hypothetical protein NTY86_12320 [Deltaproteobacteria bacterium]|nr:hypothetical protein [Deltaproteobacteria bacterium]
MPADEARRQSSINIQNILFFIFSVDDAEDGANLQGADFFPIMAR